MSAATRPAFGRRALVALALGIASGTPCAASDWPCYRGPSRDGVSTEGISKWPPTEVWRATVGSGYSQPVISGGRVYVTGGAGGPGGQDTVYCFSETPAGASPAPLWQRPYVSTNRSGAVGTFSTPAVDGTNVYTLSRGGRLGSFDAMSGTPRWFTNLNDACAGGYGVACSPLIEGSLVVLNVGSRGTAVNKATGAVAWGNDAQYGGYPSAIALTQDGRRVVAVHAGGICSGLDPATGTSLWSIAAGSTGYTEPMVCSGPGPQPWLATNACSSYHGGLLHGGYVYGYGNSAGIGGLVCAEYPTGTLRWLKSGGDFNDLTSVILAGDQLVALSGSGILAVIRPTPGSYQEVCRTPLGLAPQAALALANGRLYVRTATQVVCYDVSANAVLAEAGTLVVQEGGSAGFRVRLGRKPAANVTVTTARTGGDPDVSVEAGATRTFTPDSWDAWQTVTLAAAADADAIDGSATFACTAPGLGSAAVTAVEADKDMATTTLTVQSGGNGTAAPAGATTVPRRAPTGIQAAPAAGYTFSNWKVTSGAANLADFTSPTTTVTIASAATLQANFTTNGHRLTVTGSGHGTTTPNGALFVGNIVPVNAGISATPDPGYAFLKWTGGMFGNDFAPTTTVYVGGSMTVTAVFTNRAQAILGSIPSGYTLSVTEGRTNVFGVKLQAPPTGTITVTVARASGDADISVAAGAGLVFTPDNWGVPQFVTLAAAEDDDVQYGYATIACSAPGWAGATVLAGESENDQSVVLTVNASAGGTTAPSGANTLVIPWTSDFSLQRPIDLAATSNPSYGFANWTTPSPGNVQFADAYAASTTVKITAGVTITANFAPDTSRILAGAADVRTPEGGTATFPVKLASAPTGNVVVAVSRLSGDTNVTVASGSSLTFTPANWAAYQSVTLAAAEDSDTLDGTAVIACTAAGWIRATVTATEADGGRDSDGDGMTDANEIRAGTDPTNGASVLRLSAFPPASAAPGEVVLVWPSVSNRWYTVQAATSLAAGFSALRTNIAATPPDNVHTDITGGAMQRFYRIRVE